MPWSRCHYECAMSVYVSCKDYITLDTELHSNTYLFCEK